MDTEVDINYIHNFTIYRDLTASSLHIIPPCLHDRELIPDFGNLIKIDGGKLDPLIFLHLV